MWHLFQTVFAVGWDYFKIPPQPNSPSLVEAIRTLYGPNLPQEPSPDTEMAVNQPAVEEAPFTTVTNKKSKGKGKVPLSTNPSAPFQNVPTLALMVSRAPPLPLLAKMAIVKPTPMKVATKPQAPKQAPKSFPRFAPASAHPEYESLLCLRDMFSDLPMEKVLAMHQSGFGASVSPNRGGAVYSGASRAPKMTTHGPTRRQVLIPLDTPTAEVVVVEPRLPQSKSFLKILGVPYWGNNSSLSITQAQVESVIANTPIFEGVVLASHPYIMKASPSSDMSVIWIDIWDSQKGSKGKTLINRSFNFGRHTATV